MCPFHPVPHGHLFLRQALEVLLNQLNLMAQVVPFLQLDLVVQLVLCYQLHLEAQIHLDYLVHHWDRLALFDLDLYINCVSWNQLLNGSNL